MGFFDQFKINFFNKNFKEPALDIIDKNNEVEITAELPGIDKKDLIIKIEKDNVEIRAEKKQEKEVKKKDYYKHERSYSGFHRAFTLPAVVDPKKAKTEFKNGVLKITLPKAKKVVKKKKKAVKAKVFS